MDFKFILLGFLGLLITIYATYVKYKYFYNKNYRAACDIRKNISCTKAFSSKYGKLIGISNIVVGIIFYIAILILAYYNQTTFLLYLTALAFIGTLYLVYVSYFKLKNFCLVCTAIYIINLLLLIFSYVKM